MSGWAVVRCRTTEDSKGYRVMAHARFHIGWPQGAADGHALPGAIAWRLVGGNNRVLGCSPDPFSDFETGLAAVRHLRARIADAVPVLGTDARTGARIWRLEIDGVVVARSGRGYLRGRENLYSLAHFTASVPVADLPARAAQRTARSA